ncbi:MAG: hypothetical protein HQK50_13515 [Oligoflexia bacterium]|nr:hypothetical protein [Oligoflexia bacterium]
MKQITTFLLFCLFYLCFMAPIFSNAYAQEALERVKIVKFTPQGEQKQVSQVQVHFSEAMIAFGSQTVHKDPMQIQCSSGVEYTTRWNDEKVWVVDFKKELISSAKCDFTPSEEFKSLYGKALERDNQSYSFFTGGPAIERSVPFEKSSIKEDQAFILLFNAPIVKEKIFEKISIHCEGIHEKIAVAEMSESERNELKKNLRYIRKFPEERTLFVRPSRNFPPKSKVRLMIAPGIASLSGVVNKSGQTLEYSVREAFTVEVTCGRDNANADCNPILPIALQFSHAIPSKFAKEITLATVDKSKLLRPTFRQGQEQAQELSFVEFKAPFSQSSEFIITLPNNLTDVDGRTLQNAKSFPLIVKTNRYSPLVKFAAIFGILEANDSVLPLTIRNVEKKLLGSEMQVLIKKGDEKDIKAFAKSVATHLRLLLEKQQYGVRYTYNSKTQEQEVIDYRKWPLLKQTPNLRPLEVKSAFGEKESEFQVIGIPLQAKGFYVVEVMSEILGKSMLQGENKMYVAASSLVTNLSVHLKKGSGPESESRSLLWVTRLDDGKSVPFAKLSIHDCEGNILWQGSADQNGVAVVATYPKNLKNCDKDFIEKGYTISNQYSYGEFVFARTPNGDDVAFTHTSWNQGIESWRFNFPSSGGDRSYGGIASDSNARLHTLFDRTLLRRGEKLSMKHFVRKRTLYGLSIPSRDDTKAWGSKVLIRQLLGDKIFELPALKWDKQLGRALMEWVIPNDAPLGRYSVEVQGKSGGEFSVEDFRIPLCKALLTSPLESTSEEWVRPSSVPVEMLVQYLAGGGASGLKGKIRYAIEDRVITWPALEEDMFFANGKITPGVHISGESGDDDDSYESGSSTDASASTSTTRVKSVDFVLNKQGEFRTTLEGLDSSKDTPSNLITDVEYADPSGEVQNERYEFPLFPSKTIVGLKAFSWMDRNKKDFVVNGMVIDPQGKVVSGAKVKIELFKENYYSHRKRLVGGFYAYQHVQEIKAITGGCEATSNAQGKFSCKVNASEGGGLLVMASAADRSGKSSYANTNIYVEESGHQQWFAVDDSDRIDLLPEKKRYDVGEVAKLQVRMPFAKANALVTIERSGVLESFSKEISADHPVIEIPIKLGHIPNVFVSVLLVRGRVATQAATALVDLAKPAYKLGVAEIMVSKLEKELRIDSVTDKEIYHPREQGELMIKVSDSKGLVPTQAMEAVVAIVDEGLLELAANTTFDVAKKMFTPYAYEVDTYTAQSQIIGKRHFGQKAKLPGGGGGLGGRNPRELFDSLVYFNPKVSLNKKGEGKISFKLNDSLTKFRVMTMASAGADLFGVSDSKTIQSNMEVISFLGAPAIIREGDQMLVVATLKNTTMKSYRLKIVGQIAELLGEKKEWNETLAAGESKRLTWKNSWPKDLFAKLNQNQVKMTLTVEDDSGEFRDQLVKVVQVHPRVLETISMGKLEQLSKEAPTLEIVVAKSPSAITDRGGIEMQLHPKLADNLGGITKYMQEYAWSCLEQKVSKAVALIDSKEGKELWKKIVSEISLYVSADGLLKFYPEESSIDGNIFLTSYVVGATSASGLKLPQEVVEKIVLGARAFLEGRGGVPSYYPKESIDYGKIEAALTLLRLQRLTLQDATQLSSIVLPFEKWRTAFVLSWYELILGFDQFPKRSEWLAKIQEWEKSKLLLQGSATLFSSSGEEGSGWFYFSSGDLEAIRYFNLIQNKVARVEAGRLAKGVLSRLKRGHFDLTTANAWATLAFKQFSKDHESGSGNYSGVTMVTVNTVNGGEKMQIEPKHSLLIPWSKIKESGSEISVNYSGTAAAAGPWITILSREALDTTKAVSTGLEVKKKIIPIQSEKEGEFRSGDLVKVVLEVSSNKDMGFVVVDDPIPSGASHLNSALKRSKSLASGRATSDAYFSERSFTSFRSYFEFIPQGKTVVSEYFMRINQAGEFILPATRAESMYLPEMFATIPNGKFIVRE